MMVLQVLGLKQHGRCSYAIFYGWAIKDNRGPDPLRLMIGAEALRYGNQPACEPYHSSVIQRQLGDVPLSGALDILRLIRKKGYEALAAFEVMSDSCMPFAALVRDQYQALLDASVHILANSHLRIYA